MDWHAEGQQDVIAVAAGQFREVSYIALLAACAACRSGRLRCDHGDKQRSGAQGERRIHGADISDEPMGNVVADVHSRWTEKEPAEEVGP